MSAEQKMKSWDELRLTKTQAAGLTAGAVVLTVVLGFGPGGWVSGSKAREMVEAASASARTELAVAVCMEEFMHAENAKARLAKLQAAAWLERSELLAKAGWATMPDQKEPDEAVAVQCAARLAERGGA